MTPDDNSLLRHMVQQLTGVLAMAGAPAEPQNAAHMAEWAEGVKRQQQRIDALSTALRDALSTFRDDDKTTIVTAERQEAWAETLKEHGSLA